ncbi:MAG: heme ABC transporter permease [Gammaproteobacteria bacterium]|nr:heme ABC transporter permease [Gammaproteobacteria bacterium]
MNWFRQTFHRMGSPPYFYRGARKWITGLYIVGLALLVVGTIWGIGFTPADRLQGDSFRIIYFHVPTAHLSQLIYIAVAVAGFVFLVWRMKMADVFMVSAIWLGAWLTAFALFSGIVWGIPTWGTGWVWDARTTSVLVQLFLFIGLIALRGAIPNSQRAALAVSVLAIVGVLNIPIIKYSVDWFTTLHQPASIQIGEPIAIDLAMLWPLLINSLGLYAVAAGVILSHMRIHVLRRERDSEWVAKSLLTK